MYGLQRVWLQDVYCTLVCCIQQKWNASPQVQGNPLAAHGYQLRDDGLWAHMVPVCGAQSECHVAVEASALIIGYLSASLK